MIKHTASEEDPGLMLLLLAHWKTILIISFCGAVLAYGISWIVPQKYESSATIYVHAEPLGASAMAASMLGIPLSNRNTAGYIMSVMEGRPMKRLVAQSLDAADAKKLRLSIDPLPIRVEEDQRRGCLVLVCRTYNPHLASKIANQVLDNLSTLMVSSSTHKTKYLAKRLEETQSELDKAGNDLRRFEEKNTLSMISQDTKPLIDRLTSIETELMVRDTSLRAMDSELATAVDPEVLLNLKVRRQAEQSARDYIAKQANELRQQVSTLPAIAQQYAVLQRRIAVLGKTFEILSQEYQTARLTQVGEDGDYEIIERAEPVFEPVSPRKFWTAVMGAVLAFLVTWSCLYVRTGTPGKSAKR